MPFWRNVTPTSAGSPSSPKDARAAWVGALRPRTLPLAIAPTVLAGGLAMYAGRFDLGVFALIVLTATALQILSNFANDLGDGLKGTDDEKRLGPTRAVSAGLISVAQMKRAVAVTAGLASLLGVGLLVVSYQLLGLAGLGSFVALGLGAVAAAMGYTLGKRPLGYAGLGDFFVLLFFGWVGVGGSYVLLTGEFSWQILAPATGIGLLAAGVLNINNLRDQEGDRHHGKRTMAVRLGDRGTRQYHLLLIGAGSYFLITTPFRWGAAGHWFVWVPALLVIVALRQAFEVAKTEELRRLNPSLGKLAMLTAVWGIALGAAMGAAAYA